MVEVWYLFDLKEWRDEERKKKGRERNSNKKKKILNRSTLINQHIQ